MSLSAAALQLLLDKGLSLADVVELASVIEESAPEREPSLSPGAVRTRKWREKQEAQRHGDVTVTDHGDVSHVGASACVVNTSLPSLRSEEVSNPLRSPSESFPPKPKIEARGCRLPEGWEPDRDDKDEAVALLGSHTAARAELDKFRDYWRAVPGAKGRKLDWPATWRNWVRRSAEDQPRHGQRTPNVPGPDHKLAAKDANLARALAGADAGADFLAERRRSGF